MILAEKITALRKQKGWSQEELAHQLEVSRQAVFKWESASAIPDLERILKMSEIFEVSTDYLLKEKEEKAPAAAGETEESQDLLRRVSLEEAESFLEKKKKLALSTALATASYILCPVLLIFLAAFSEMEALDITEEAAGGLGLVVLLLIVAGATVVLVLNSGKTEIYDFMKKERFRLAYGVDGIVRRRRSELERRHHNFTAAGIFFCISSALPIFFVMIFTENEMVLAMSIDLVLLLVALGVFLCVLGSEEWDACQMLLQEGQFTPEEKASNNRNLHKVDWCVVTAVYLALSLSADGHEAWRRSWVVWPCAGVLFGAVRGIERMRIRRRNQTQI